MGLFTYQVLITTVQMSLKTQPLAIAEWLLGADLSTKPFLITSFGLSSLELFSGFYCVCGSVSWLHFTNACLFLTPAHFLKGAVAGRWLWLDRFCTCKLDYTTMTFATYIKAWVTLQWSSLACWDLFVVKCQLCLVIDQNNHDNDLQYLRHLTGKRHSYIRGMPKVLR